MNLSETAEVPDDLTPQIGRSSACACDHRVRARIHIPETGRPPLLPEDGQAIGNLSGGCLEGQVEEIARDVMTSGQVRLEMYDLTAEDEVVWGWGLGCNGAIEVFIEPAKRAAETAYALRAALDESRSLAVATVIGCDSQSIERSARLVVYPSGEREGSLGEDSLEAAVSACARGLDEGVTDVVEVDFSGGRVRLFVEVLEPPLRLLVCGAGHDAKPLAGRGCRRPSRVPGCAALPRRRRVRGRETGRGRRAGATRRPELYRHESQLLARSRLSESFLGSEAAYIGMLGRARLERLLDDLASEGARPSGDQLGRVYGPARLDLGGEGPEEIAAAIVAEILAVSRGRQAGSLRQRSGPIHERSEPVAT